MDSANQLQVLRSSHNRVVPWKNGRGVTREIAIFPADATIENFIWRASSATVSEAGLFSLFPGYHRDLVVLDGEGLNLTIKEANGGRDRLESIERLRVFRFDGNQEIHCQLKEGPVRDFNLIFRQDKVNAVTEVSRNDRHFKVAEGTYIVFCASGNVHLESPERIRLEAGDAIILPVDSTASVHVELLSTEGTYIWIRLA